jgi:hypothetical protein
MQNEPHAKAAKAAKKEGKVVFAPPFGERIWRFPLNTFASFAALA